MPIQIYDSLRKKKVSFEPIQAGKMKMYSCGVTVYDECHIGHARSLYIFDVIKRYLKYRDFDVTFVRNITDIDDKIINKAKELGISAKEVAEKYIASYYKDLETLSIERADFEPKATENIPEMIEHIQGLIEKGFAYEVSGDVYFSVRKFKDYGKLSGQSIEQMQEAVRIEKDPKKKDPLDFALWKKSNEDEPGWSSPWGRGRPGWHIECSVMSAKFLKTETLDIHAGGRDLIFPHHENEIAQSEALTGKPFAKYWIHHGLLTINGQKMAKSAGNFVTVQDALKNYQPTVIKIFFLDSLYTSPIDFSEDKMQEAKNRVERIFHLINEIDRRLSASGAQPKPNKFQEIEDIKDRFIEAMDDDFNTHEAIAKIFDIVNITYERIDDLNFISVAKTTIKELLGILGIPLKLDAVVSIKGPLKITITVMDPTIIIKNGVSEEIKIKILERDKARKDKNYVLADKIRKELEEKGIILKDTEDGVSGIWRKP